MSQGQEQTREELLARIAQLESNQRSAGTGIKIAAKGGISLYGVGRFPVTLYASQWRAVAEKMPAIVEFLAANKGKYAEKAKDGE